MESLEYLIRHENENTRLDFKAVQYDKPRHEAFIKDIMAMANAVGPGDRHIIVGVAHQRAGDREIVGIDKDEFVEPAIYQQLVSENIEPQIEFEYLPFTVDGKMVGVFRIYGYADKPYMMRKDYGRLNKGDAFIRRGDSQDRLVRRDVDAIYDQRARSCNFDSHVQIGFDFDGFPAEITLPVCPPIEFPSVKAERKISDILARRKALEERKQKGQLSAMEKLMHGIHRSSISTLQLRALEPFRSIPYEERTTAELEEALVTVGERYVEDDLYVFFELHSSKVNFRLLNSADRYIEDASIEMRVPKHGGIRIADKIHRKPDPGKAWPYLMSESAFSGYPDVSLTDAEFVISQDIGPIRHHITETAFGEAIRIVFLKDIAGQTIDIRLTLRGKNLPKPLERQLTIHVDGGE